MSGPKLVGKSAIITGGARGIGRAIALAFAREGANLAVIDLSAHEADEITSLSQSVRATGPNFLYRQADVTKTREVSSAIADFLAVQPSTILVNCAGKGSDPTPLEGVADDEWHHLIALNLSSAFYCSRAVVSSFKAAGGGSIINLASTAGRGLSENSSLGYASAKAGIVGFTRQLARELGPFDIRVNAIAPGSILSGRVTERFNGADDDNRQKTLSSIPLRKMGQPEDVAAAALFLASEDSRFMTGTIIDVNGGRSMV